MGSHVKPKLCSECERGNKTHRSETTSASALTKNMIKLRRGLTYTNLGRLQNSLRRRCRSVLNHVKRRVRKGYLPPMHAANPALAIEHATGHPGQARQGWVHVKGDYRVPPTSA